MHRKPFIFNLQFNWARHRDVRNLFNNSRAIEKTFLAYLHQKKWSFETNLYFANMKVKERLCEQNIWQRAQGNCILSSNSPEKSECRNLNQPSFFAMIASVICRVSTAILAAAPEGSTKPSSFQGEQQQRASRKQIFYSKCPAPWGTPEKTTSIFMIL